MGEGAAELDQAGDARGVVDRAVVDSVAFGVGQTDAQMVPVGGVDHPLVRVFRAGKNAHHIVRDHLPGVDREGGGEGDAAQRGRLEVAGLGERLLGLEVEARGLEQGDRRVVLDPGFEGGVDLGRVLADDVEDRVGVGVLDRVPAVGGGAGLVDHDEADGAAARGLLILVGPAAVVGHGLAAEVAPILAVGRGLVVGVVDQDERDLAMQIDTLEVVPIALRRLHAIADEDHGDVLHVDPGDAGLRRADGDLDALVPGHGLAAGLGGEGDRALDVKLGEGDVLGPGPADLGLVAARLQARGLELAGNVGDRLGLARGRGAAALEGV